MMKVDIYDDILCCMVRNVVIGYFKRYCSDHNIGFGYLDQKSENDPEFIFKLFFWKEEKSLEYSFTKDDILKLSKIKVTDIYSRLEYIIDDISQL